MMIRLIESVKTWGSAVFDETFKSEVASMGAGVLPLQQALTQSNRVSDKGFSVMVLSSSSDDKQIRVKAGIFFSGVNAGSCCADDPSPLDDISEYCEIQFKINRASAETVLFLLQD